MELAAALDFARARHQGALTTLRRDGRAQISNIVYAIGTDGVARISVTDGRAKTKNLRRDPRALLYVHGESHWIYAVLDGEAELSPVAERPDDATADELVDVYRALSGEHPNWDEYRAAMVAERRLVVRLRATSAYGQLPG
ncbi:MAG TPA: PPOX class F420-dependent oxidoreductase [Acidimicrobiia bacterium]|jgi:PPOX class probable F420-dependent enzyme|nr:PPOX class F420-dependent oxidoreductase [Acidimicrobiia bacterium]